LQLSIKFATSLEGLIITALYSEIQRVPIISFGNTAVAVVVGLVVVAAAAAADGCQRERDKPKQVFIAIF